MSILTGIIAYSHSVFSPTSSRPSMQIDLPNFTPAAMMHSEVTPLFFVGMSPTQITSYIPLFDKPVQVVHLCEIEKEK